MKRTIEHIAITIMGIGLYFLFGSSCIPEKRLLVNGTLYGRAIQTTVDDELARLMLIDPNSREVESLFAAHESEPLSTTTLAGIAEEHSMDVATLYFMQRAYQNERNKSAQDRYLAHLDQFGGDSVGPQLAALKGYYVAFVPGLDYNDTTNGGNFARQRRLLSAHGVQNEMIVTGDWGYTDDNAAIVAARLKELSVEHERIIVVSASKGGLETAVALGRIMKPEESTAVKAWVSVGGILKGSPVADTYLHWPKCWVAEVGLKFVGQKIDLVKDVSYAKRADEFDGFTFPEHLMRLHFIGAPLATQVEKRIRSHYCSISSFGPNDGITPLADEVTDDGVIITELGLDHYYKSPDIDKKTIALALVVAEEQN